MNVRTIRKSEVKISLRLSDSTGPFEQLGSGKFVWVSRRVRVLIGSKISEKKR